MDDVKSLLIQEIRRHSLGESTPEDVADAIEALIHEKLAEALNLMADRVQDVTGVRP
jgi:hypothetical protein